MHLSTVEGGGLQSRRNENSHRWFKSNRELKNMTLKPINKVKKLIKACITCGKIESKWRTKKYSNSCSKKCRDKYDESINRMNETYDEYRRELGSF